MSEIVGASQRHLVVSAAIVQSAMERLQQATSFERPVRWRQLREATDRLTDDVIEMDGWLRRVWDKVDEYDGWLKAHPEVDDYAERVQKAIALEDRLIDAIDRYTVMHQVLGSALRVLNPESSDSAAAPSFDQAALL